MIPDRDVEGQSVRLVHHLGNRIRIPAGRHASADSGTALDGGIRVGFSSGPPGLSVLLPTGRHASVADEVFSELPHLRGNLIHDATIAILMREHGIKVIYTQDTDFHRFPFLEPVDPTV